MNTQNSTEFLTKLTQATCTALNSKAGQDLTKKLLEAETKKNPNMTKEEWEKKKTNFATYLSLLLLKENKDLSNELATHLYNELKEA